MLRSTDDNYGSMAKFLHWLISILFIGMIIFGFILVNLPKGNTTSFLVGIHKSIGLTVLLIVIFRVIWRFSEVQPLLPITVPIWEKIAAHSVQFFLYIVLFAMPISGWIMSSLSSRPFLFWGWFNAKFPFPKNLTLSNQFFTAHEVIAWLAVGLICLHVGAAVKHHFIEKNNVLKRMLPGYRPPHLFRD